MKKVDIQFGGMSIAPDDQVARDGDMAMLMNARIKKGEIVPMNKDAVFDIPNEKKVIQSQFHGDRLLELYEDGTLKVLKTYDSTEYDEELSAVFASVKVDSFAILGNVVVLSGVHNDEINNFFVLLKNGIYSFLGKLPEIKPHYTLSREQYKSETIEVSDDDSITNMGENGFTDIKDTFYKNILLPQAKEGLDVVYEKKGYVDRAMFFCVINILGESFLSDAVYCELEGEYIGPNNFIILKTDGALEKGQLEINYFTFNAGNITMPYNWRDLISSVDIYTTGSLLSHKEAKDTHTTSWMNYIYEKEYNMWVLKEPREIVDDFNNSLLYKIGTFDKNGKYEELIENTSPTSLLGYDILNKVANNSFTYRGVCYNNRLHGVDVNDIITKDIFPLKRITPSSDLKDVTFEVIVKAKINNEDKYSRFEKTKGISDGFSPIMITPSLTAEEVTILKNNDYVCLSKNGTNVFGAFFASTKNIKDSYTITSLPSDYYFKIDFLTHPPRHGEYEIRYVGGTIKFKIKGTDHFYVEQVRKGSVTNVNNYTKNATITISTSSSILLNHEPETVLENTEANAMREYLRSLADPFYKKDKSILRVSEIDNPFYFPATQEYKFEGDVIKVVSNSEAVSSGQFGQYPLYVFTTEGVWAMQVDTTGKTAYAAQVPISREVCNGDAVATTNGIAFTTKRGVMMINGAQVTEISQGLDGLQVALFRHSGELMLNIVNRYRNEDEKFEGNIKPVPIREFIDGAKLGWFYNEGELLVYNPKFLYSYVYNVKSQTWYMVDRNYVMRAENLGPQSELLLYGDDKKRYVFGMDDKTSTFVAITRPIKTNSLDYKRLRQAALRCTCKSLGRLGFYVLASNNGGDFVCITGKEAPKSNFHLLLDHRDLVTTMSRSRQYKYFAIAIAGDMTGSVSFAELLLDEGFANNKLR